LKKRLISAIFFVDREERTKPLARRHQIDEKPAIGDVFF
jgi:hypothetical protein